ncbi:MAG: prepilin-type N-terminal cleavage/methylation domain-containing protein [Proteobacteria bacterium]|nr:MAG: prepilin-type N-terminal cleavage/methylation domain-containing protein [Pseudomonadota bacterium]
MKSNRGVTLIELMVTVAVVAILAAFAVPSFQELIRSSRLSTAANDLSTALALARGEAIRRGGRVTLCRSSTATNATPVCDTGGGSWGDGWVLFVNADADTPPAIDAGEEILRRGDAVNGNTLVIQTTADVASSVTYRPDGTARLDNNQLTNGVLRVCAPGGSNSNARDLRLRPGGRVIVSRMTSAGCSAAPTV